MATNDFSNRASTAADKALGSHHERSTTGDVVGETVGGLSGAATGAALGSLGGPIGTIIGGIAGAATGWWSGRAVSEAASTFDKDEDFYRNHHSSRVGSSASSSSYDTARPAYQLGHVAGLNPDYQGRSFDQVEPDLRRGYESYASSTTGAASYNDVRDYARDAYGRGQEQRIVLSEEQLRVGKREVQAGEVNLRTTVESQRVSETVGLTHDEVTIERRPLSATDASAANLTIGEESIRVPLTREEAVVEKRVVPVEEVVVRTNTVTENQTVEDTVRRERLVTEGLEGQTGASHSTAGLSGSGLSATQGTSSGGGLLDRASDKLDDLKDRVDGNPASRPGRDATDPLGSLVVRSGRAADALGRGGPPGAAQQGAAG